MLHWLLIAATFDLALSKTLCVYSKKDVQHLELDRGSLGELLDDNTTMQCPERTNFCFVLWKEDSFNQTTLLAQGCWESSGDLDCGSATCVSDKRPPKAINQTKFCCCQGHFCNQNFTDAYVPLDNIVPALQFVEQASYKTELVIILASIFSLAVLAVAAIVIFRLWSSSHKPNPRLHLIEAPPPNDPQFDLEELKIQEVIGRGRFGQVCRATLGNGTAVAVKIFAVQNRQYFVNEREIYSLAHMEHPSLPSYIGSDERTGDDGRPEYLLVLSLAPLGCLQEFLRHNTLDWNALCKMAQTLTQGLAHLHTEIKRGDKVKPCVAHRDLNSRNILVKTDGSCELCDFGFAIRISGSKYFQNGEEQVAETTSLADVGTLRYMAPEVLEGAVNLRDCETSLKQIDIYALGLILWEIATRCSDLYQGMEVPQYRLPFEAEIGLHPTMEQMQVLVTRNKARPLFPDIWKASNLAIRLLKETIGDCWDQDAEARLTALCVEERLIELPVLWERHKIGNSVSGVSPTVNLYNVRPTVLANLNGFIVMDDKNNDSSVSESTADTMLTTSPTTEPQHIKNNNNNSQTMACSFPRFSMPLQPHQGRNPCMERNLMTSDDLSVNGNLLLERSEKDKDLRFLLSENHPLTPESQIPTSRSLGNPPIPFLQNAVHASMPPKQPNLPGNGRRPNNDSRFSGSRFVRSLRSFLDRRKKMQGATEEEDQQPLKGSPEKSPLAELESKSNLLGVNKSNPVLTRVCVVGQNTREMVVPSEQRDINDNEGLVQGARRSSVDSGASGSGVHRTQASQESRQAEDAAPSEYHYSDPQIESSQI